MSPYLIRDRMRMETVLENPYVLMTTQPISSVQELMGAIGQVMRRPEPLIILAEKVDGAALGMLVQNNQHGTMEATAIRAPGFGHRRVAYLEDLAAFTGGQVITPEAGLTLESVELESLGRARRVIVREDYTTFIEGAGHEESRRRAAERDPRRARARDARGRHRRAARAARAAVLAAGGHPRRRRDRRREQGEACAAPRARWRPRARRCPRASSPGGGTALLRAEAALDGVSTEGDRGAGIDVVRAALSDPLFWIASNAGYDGQAVVDQVRAMPHGHGLNALTGTFGDLFVSGVVDPVRVTRLSLQNAASVAALMLTTEALVAEELIGQPGAIMAPGFGDLAEGMARPSSPV